MRMHLKLKSRVLWRRTGEPGAGMHTVALFQEADIRAFGIREELVKHVSEHPLSFLLEVTLVFVIKNMNLIQFWGNCVILI